MKKLFFIIMIVVLPLLFAGCTKDDQISQLQKQNQNLQTQLAKQSQSSNLDLQAKCGDAANKFFLKTFGHMSNEPGRYTTNYISHYNKELDKCFIEIYAFSTAFVYEHYELWDVYENNNLAECNRNLDGKVCFILSVESTPDNIKDKFYNFSESYMSN